MIDIEKISHEVKRPALVVDHKGKKILRSIFRNNDLS